MAAGDRQAGAANGVLVHLCAALIAALMLGLPGRAEAQQPVVVELFTSQGCSACPPAEAIFAGLAAREDVIALALHVDYWDYLGWADAFAQPRFTDRQKSYARAAGKRMIYTPQVIVAGAGHVEGSRAEDIAATIRRHAEPPPRVRLELERHGDRLVIRATAEPPLDRTVTVQLVRYAPTRTMTVERGENAGRTQTYHNVVTEWDAIAQWAGAAPLTMDAPVHGPDPVVVLVQDQGPGAILAAARLR